MARTTNLQEFNDSKLPKTAYIYCGPPVVGKDAQTSAYKEHIGIPVFETGPILKAKAANNPGGPEDRAIKSGNLVHDDTVMWLAKQWILQHTGRPLIKLNGIPRNVNQLPIVERLREHGFAPKVIWFTTPPEVCMARPYREDRPEDNLENRIRRMEVYRRETLPVRKELARYGISKEHGNLLLIDNTEIQKHQVAEKIIQFFKLPFQVPQLFPNLNGTSIATA